MKIRYTLLPYAGNKANYEPVLGYYDTVIDFFGGSLGGTLQTVISNPECTYYVAEASNSQRSLIRCFQANYGAFDSVKEYAIALIDELFKKDNYGTASKWLSAQYSKDNPLLVNAALSVMRRFFFSSVLRTTPGSGNINVWISVRKILGDTTWKKVCKQFRPAITDFTKLKGDNLKEFNRDLGQYVFENGILKEYMVKSVKYWYNSIQPLLTEWFAVERKLIVVSDYRELFKVKPIGSTLCYCDPPYFNDQIGSFVDEAGRKRRHKQTSAYEHHNPQSLETWDMFEQPLQYAIKHGCDLVACNYSSPKFIEAMDNLKQLYDLETMIEGKACLCTGRRSKYTTAPIGKEFVIFGTPKECIGTIAA